MKKVVIITQARTGSTRFPGKVLHKSILGHSLLDHHINRLKKSKYATQIILATTTKQSDDVIVEKYESVDIQVFRGSEDDVLERFYLASKAISAEIIVRVTSDCPLIDPVLIDEVIEMHIKTGADYTSNSQNETFPDGQDVEVINHKALEQAYQLAKEMYQREHVTPFIKENPSTFKISHFDSKINFKDIRMTVDTESDLEVINILLDKVGEHSSWLEYNNYYIEHKLYTINGNQIRNEGFLKSIENEKK